MGNLHFHNIIGPSTQLQPSEPSDGASTIFYSGRATSSVHMWKVCKHTCNRTHTVGSGIGYKPHLQISVNTDQYKDKKTHVQSPLVESGSGYKLKLQLASRFFGQFWPSCTQHNVFLSFCLSLSLSLRFELFPTCRSLWAVLAVLYTTKHNSTSEIR